MPITVKCMECGEAKEVRPYRAASFRFCSCKCAGLWRSKHWTGDASPLWQGGLREKECSHCGVSFVKARRRAVSLFQGQKFCSKECADRGGLRYHGEANANWNGNPRRSHRGGKHAAWAVAVISRDHATCQMCGARDTELHAHHIKSYKDAPDLRWELSNGLTVCAPCHWKIHSGPTANGVNSGEAAAGQAGGNPEPSFGRKPVEGVTTRGRAYRRWEGACSFCGAFLSKRWSDVTGKRHVFCGRRCAGKHSALLRGFNVHGGNSSTSALPETDDIVWAHVKA